MRINSFSDVCLRLLMVLTSAPDGELSTTRDLAEQINTPYNHVSKAVLKLRQMGLVEAVRGRSGGVRIAPPGEVVTVGAVLRELDDRIDVANCLGDNASCEVDMGACPLAHSCGLRGILNNARESFYASLDGVSISSLARKRPGGPVPVTLDTSRLR